MTGPLPFSEESFSSAQRAVWLHQAACLLRTPETELAAEIEEGKLRAFICELRPDGGWRVTEGAMVEYGYQRFQRELAEIREGGG